MSLGKINILKDLLKKAINKSANVTLHMKSGTMWNAVKIDHVSENSNLFSFSGSHADNSSTNIADIEDVEIFSFSRISGIEI